MVVFPRMDTMVWWRMKRGMTSLPLKGTLGNSSPSTHVTHSMPQYIYITCWGICAIKKQSQRPYGASINPEITLYVLWGVPPTAQTENLLVHFSGYFEPINYTLTQLWRPTTVRCWRNHCKKSCERHVVQPLAGAIRGHGGGMSGRENEAGSVFLLWSGKVSPTIHCAHLSFDLLDGFFSRVNMSSRDFIISVLISWCRSCWMDQCHELWSLGSLVLPLPSQQGSSFVIFQLWCSTDHLLVTPQKCPPHAWPPCDWTLKWSRTWKSHIKMKVRNRPTSTVSWWAAKLLRFATDGGCVFWRRL